MKAKLLISTAAILALFGFIGYLALPPIFLTYAPDLYYSATLWGPSKDSRKLDPSRDAQNRAYDQGHSAGERFARENYAAGARVMKENSALALTAKSKQVDVLNASDFQEGFESGYHLEWKRLAK